MSGLRVKHEELGQLGMTLPGFIERGRVIASLPSLSLLTLAAHTPENWEPEYLEIDEVSENAAAHIASGGYDIVAISSLTARILEAYKISDYLRALGTTVVLGGLHVSALPCEALLHADAILQGEGELLWSQLLGGCPRTRKIIVFENLNLYKSIVYKQDFLKKVDSRTAS